MKLVMNVTLICAVSDTNLWNVQYIIVTVLQFCNSVTLFSLALICAVLQCDSVT